MTRPSVVPAILCAGGLHGELAEGTNREGHKSRARRRILGWLRRKTHGTPQGRAPNPEQSGDFAGDFFPPSICSRAWSICSGESFRFGPSFTPRRFAAFTPAFVRSIINPRSNSASKATMCSIARPSGYLVSICSVML